MPAHALQSGDSFVVCDVGGGTAVSLCISSPRFFILTNKPTQDLITYMLESRQTWELSECAIGAG